MTRFLRRAAWRTAARFMPAVFLGLTAGSAGAQARPLPTIAERTAGMQAMPGFFPLYWDEATGKLYWEIDKLDTEFLYQVSMASGLGSNPVGIDRGQLSGTYVLVARRTGPRVLLEQPNYKYQARVDNPDQKEAVRDAFAPSVHWGFDVVAQTGKSVLVDASPFFLRDARGVIETLARTNQGRYQVDGSRSVLYPARIKSFPENAEVEALLTFTSAQPGPLVNGVAASGEAVTLRIHHSLVKMPDAGYSPRYVDPRIGVSGPTVMDFSRAVNEDIFVRFAARHRLKKKNPGAARSEPVKPITYYVDPGIPEPIRTAVVEGTRWWNQADRKSTRLNSSH